jgi:spoIIIJ-associated protein
VTDELTVEATGETARDAKWNALRELERLAPTLDRSTVRFQVLSEGERGLLGVGYEPARVVASVAAPPAADAPAGEEEPAEGAAARARAAVAHITAAMGLQCRVELVEREDSIEVRCSGDDLGLLIGRHGQTIDAVQTLANAIASAAGDDDRTLVVDAAGYRDRRRQALEGLAARAADEAVRTGERVELEPMSPPERKLVHQFLAGFEGVATASEGNEPDRRIVVFLA